MSSPWIKNFRKAEELDALCANTHPQGEGGGMSDVNKQASALQSPKEPYLEQLHWLVLLPALAPQLNWQQLPVVLLLLRPL